jgi:hypothetical protein
MVRDVAPALPGVGLCSGTVLYRSSEHLFLSVNLNKLPLQLSQMWVVYIGQHVRWKVLSITRSDWIRKSRGGPSMGRSVRMRCEMSAGPCTGVVVLCSVLYRIVVRHLFRPGTE